MDSLFTRFPSKTELDKFANDGDTGAFSKTLQVVAADDSVPCGVKVNYLLELLGSIKAAIQRKTLLADQLVSIIDGAKAEIARLQGEIARVQRDRDGLNLPGLQKTVNDLVSQLQPFYDRINAVKTQIPPEEARVAGFTKEIDTLSKQNDAERNRISNDQLKLATTINLIRDLQQKLKDAQDNQTALEASIAKSQGIIRDNDAKIANIRSTITEIQAKIKSLQDTADNLKRQANTLEVNLERARTDLSVATVKDNKFADDIKVLKDRINAQQPKLVDDDLNKLRTLIANLNATVPNVQAAIDREYYYCYGAGKVETVTTGNTIVYVVRGEAFGQYIDNAYGQSVRAPQLRTSGDYRLQVVDPFSPVWTAKFGYPSVARGRGSGSGAGWTAGSGDFSCLGSLGGGSSSGSGVITGISNDGFEVKDASGKSASLRVGSCSRLESTSSLPKVGQSMVWRGAPSSNGGYNIYSGTCWD
jgi:predicted  nucleic acid-binding Zn-ribbon protein